MDTSNYIENTCDTVIYSEFNASMWEQIDCRPFCAWTSQSKKNCTSHPGDPLLSESLPVHLDIHWQVKKDGVA